MGHFHLLKLKGMTFLLPRGKYFIRSSLRPLKEVKCPIPVRNEGISTGNLSINSLKISLNIKDCGNENPRWEKTYFTK